MNFKLIYISPNGSTRKTSEVLKTAIEKNGHTAELLDLGLGTNRNNYDIIFNKLKEADVVGFGSPAYHMDLLEPMQRLFEEMLLNPEVYHFKAFLYLNYAGITSGKAFLNTAKLFAAMDIPIIGGMKVVSPHFHHQEPFPTAISESFIQSFYYQMQSNAFASIKSERLYDMFSHQKIRVKLLYPLVHDFSKKRALTITILSEQCVSCGKCKRECPVGAISLDDTAVIDLEKCIHCYHCLTACKLKAIEAPIEKLDQMIRINKLIIGMEKPQNYIYM
ncbi:EFR1 family ferrodoxin [Acetobacterium bakii]|uniref:Ferredoxin n=1 Tax=Acetobacterium bakii TaxID=52689 RepID=A0A0L6TZ97_9FIRM|nr:EFR1 family ferrodoxin [Acetobacterium bakii]KNZ41599.1 hypothetical protein AKG39_11485 [Acetobacterium bakii]